MTDTNLGARGARRWIDAHRVFSIASSLGGKNSNETVTGGFGMGMAVVIGAYPESRVCGDASGSSRDGRLRVGHGQHEVLAVDVDGTQAGTDEPGLVEPAAQGRQRVCGRQALGEGLVILDQQKFGAGREQSPDLAQCIDGSWLRCERAIQDRNLVFRRAPEAGT